MEDLEKLLQLLKRKGIPTYTDDPRMGNVMPYQIPGSQFPPPQSGEEQAWHSLARKYESPNLEGQLDLEALLLRKKFEKMMQHNQNQVNRGPRFQLDSEGYDRLPGMLSNKRM